MDRVHFLDETSSNQQCLLHFWAFGDLHYRARDKCQSIHSQRLAPLFQDVRALWEEEGFPDFTVSPGDTVQTGAPENYQLAKQDLAAHLGPVPFYPGIGNHEFHREHRACGGYPS